MNWSSSGIDWLYFFEDEYRKRHVTGCPT
jgi:hypothetical protein